MSVCGIPAIVQLLSDGTEQPKQAHALRPDAGIPQVLSILFECGGHPLKCVGICLCDVVLHSFCYRECFFQSVFFNWFLQ